MPVDGNARACYKPAMAASSKPGAFKLMGWLGRLPGPVLRGALRVALLPGLSVYRGGMRRTFARIVEFQGRAASKAEVGGLMRAFVAYYAGSLANLCRIFASSAPPRPPVPVALEALPEIERLRRRGKGVILATPHFGDLYSAILALGARLPLTVLMVTGEHYRWAESGSLKFVEFLGGAAEVVAALERNECVLVYDDVDFIPGNRTADFFGGPVFSPHGPPRLALATGAAILPVAALWSSTSTRVVCDAPILPDGKSQEELEAACLRALERLILRAPEQWMILYDLWDLDEMRRVAGRFRARAAERSKRI